MARRPGGWPGLYAALALGAALVVTPALDRPLFTWAQAAPEGGWVRVWGEIAYQVGLGGWQIAVMLLLAVLGWVLSLRRLAWTGIWGATAVAVSGILVQALKHLIGRPRPRMGLPMETLVGPTLASDFHSFPSGHSATSFALAAFLAARYPRAGWAFYLGAMGVAAGRIFAGSHFITDSLAGASLGLMVGIPLAWWVGRRPEGTP